MDAETLRARVLEYLAKEPLSNLELRVKLGFAPDDFDGIRALDRILQKLRKGGHITPGRLSGRALWFAAGRQMCPTCHGTGYTER